MSEPALGAPARSWLWNSAALGEAVRFKHGSVLAVRPLLTDAADQELTAEEFWSKVVPGRGVGPYYGASDRAQHEMRVLAEIFEYAVSYDQNSVASLASFEILAWRWQLLLTAHEVNPLPPDYGGSEYFDPLGASKGEVAPQLQRTGAKQMRDDAEVQTQRSKARELRSAGWAPPRGVN
jgi:hypothetical protein